MTIKPLTGLFILLAIISLPLFGRLDSMPIQLWDESRLAINSLEMNKSGLSLVTTFYDTPDMWNTKPPLLIWLQVISLKIFGLNELALRLPSALAGLFTCLLIYWFFAKKLFKPWIGILSCAVLVTSLGYIKYHHSPRTGDYDSLLTLFTTLYCLCFYLYIEERKTKYLYLFFTVLILAALTKGIAGLLFIPALFLFALYRKSVIMLLKQKHLYFGIASFLFLVLGYYFLREHYNPGYLEAIRNNELGGRFLKTDGTNGNDIQFYYHLLINSYFKYWIALLPCGLLLGYFAKDDKIRSITVFSFLAAFSHFILISKGQTKNDWYDMPEYPFWAIICGIGIYQLCMFICKTEFWKSELRVNMLPYLLLILLFFMPYRGILNDALFVDPGDWIRENEDMGYYMKEVMHKQRKAEDLLFARDGDYQANIRWYERVMEQQNRPIDTVSKENVAGGQKVVAYQANVKEYIESHFNFDIKEKYRSQVIVYQIHGPKQ